MRFETWRLHAPEWMIAIASALLLIDTFALPWYEAGANFGQSIVQYPHTATSGWSSLTVLRYLIVLTALVGLAIWWLQATRESPALPTIVTELAIIPAAPLLLALIWRVFITTPSIYGLPTQLVETKAGAYLGVLLAALIVVGIYRWLRVDGVSSKTARANIEHLTLDDPLAGRTS
jgi:hypothetical protein